MPRYPIIDLHEDTSAYFIYFGGGEPFGDLKEDLPDRDADIPKYLRGNIKIVFSSIFPGILTFKPSEYGRMRLAYGKWLPAIGYRVPQAIILEHFSIYYRLVEAYPELRIIESLTDVDDVMGRNDKVGLILHMEGADPIDDPYDLVIFKRLGLRSIAITWNYNNKYGSGCMSKKDYGLTPDGEELVRMANKLGIIVDLAHASKRTAIEAMQVSTKPVIISHANVRRFVDSPRNVDDEVLEALHKNGGVIGVTFISSLISQKPKPAIDDLVQHIMYIYERFGTDIIAIGSDFHGLLGLPKPEGLETIDKVQNLLEKLAERGLGDNDLRKIAYENALRVIKANLT
jgi:membrane dipeptidase